MIAAEAARWVEGSLVYYSSILTSASRTEGHAGGACKEVTMMFREGKVANWCWFALLSSLLCQSVVAITDPAEKDALGSVSNSLIDDGNLGSWDPATDPCESWLGVLCVPNDYPPELVNSNYSHVTELRLLSLNLSGTLAPQLGDFPALKYLDFMWNKLTGSIPPSIGNLDNLQLLLLNGNELTGVLPQEIGNLKKLNRIQIDQNKISGPVPDTFGNLSNIQHLHMNNNSLSGSIPPQLGYLPKVVHILLDNNNLSGILPPELSQAKTLLIIQLDNNQFDNGTQIPAEYGKIPSLLKLSLRNCNLVGPIPELTDSKELSVIDLSYNRLNQSIPTGPLPTNLTAIDFSNNDLTGDVPDNIGSLPQLEFLELRNNRLSGNISGTLGTGPSFTGNNSQVVLDFQNNSLGFTDNSPLADLQGQLRVQVWMYGNPAVCPADRPSNNNPFCGQTEVGTYLGDGVPQATSVSLQCSACNEPYVLVPNPSLGCRCGNPITVLYRLKSPGFAMFDLYEEQFRIYLSQGLSLSENQVYIRDYTTQPGPRIAITVLLFPSPSPDFNQAELGRLYSMFANWNISDSTVFGPYELIQYVPPASVDGGGGSSKLSAGAIAGIVVGILLAVILAPLLLFVILRKRGWSPGAAAVKRRISVALRKPIDVSGVRTFTFEEMQRATDNFGTKNILGQGGYGKVYYGTLENGQKVAVKRAEEGSLQGANEFETEIQLLSRVHHRNLVSLVGYCNDEGEHTQGEQMLVYEYISNGNLRDHLNKSTKFPLDFLTRLRIALGSARGVHYLHTQADPPIFHRDIKATNILLDDKYNAKVADFGLSKLAPTDVDFEGANAGHVSTVVKGTPGYLDPEYFLTHKLTDKSDVYSFGVVLLELITGMYPISHGKNIVREVNMAFVGGGMADIVDKRMGTFPSETMEPFTRLALSCCKGETDSRPSMAEVLHELEEIWKDAPWSDVGSHSYVGDTDSRDFSMGVPRGFSTEMNMYDRSDGTNSDLISGTNINIQPR